MTIAERSQTSDLRVVYGLLANSALKELDHPANSTSEVYFVNLVRLLDMYKHGKFSGHRPHGVLESKPLRQYSLVNRDRGEKDVRHALDVARRHADPSSETEPFVSSLRETLLTLARGNSKSVSTESISLLKRFITKLAEELRDRPQG
jgi:hypothetical protein